MICQHLFCPIFTVESLDAQAAFEALFLCFLLVFVAIFLDTLYLVWVAMICYNYI